jgi:PAS domain S-box-containing protein
MTSKDASPSDKVPLLLVDDKHANLLVLEAVLPAADYELVMVQSGGDAIREVSRRDFAVVILDVQMPGMDGFDTATKLKDQMRGKPVPIIFVTAIDFSRADVLRAYAGGAVDFIQKPLIPEIIRGKVAVFADLYRAHRQLVLEKQRSVENLTALQKAEDARLRDITRRRVAEEQLHVSEARFHHLVDAVTDYAIVLLDLTGHVATWNAGAKRTKGYEWDEIIGKHYSVFYTPEDRAGDKPDRVLETVHREGRFEEESWRVRKDGTRFWADVVITALRDPRGDLIGFAQVTRDLTQRRCAEENERKLAREQFARAAAETERHRLLTLLEQVPAVITLLRGPDFVFEFANPKAVDAMGYGDVLGKPLLVACPEMREQPPFHHLRRVFETGEPFTQHEALAWRDVAGRRVETYWNSVFLPVRDPTGAIEGVMTFEFDVTENVVARHGLEAASKANQRAREELERSNRAKDEFLATMSHELRSPLNAIFGWATILRKSRLDQTKLEHGLEVIERNAKAQTRLVSDLLDVSRIISGKLQLRLSKTELSPLIHDAADVVRPAADAKGLRLLVDLDPDIGANVVDADRLRQVMWNLLINAVRFTPRGGRITVSGDRTASGVVIRVHDTGVGIGPEHLPHIFERFTQVDSSATRTHGGLGLGLAIVRHLVELHGGTVEAQSAGLGQGTTFCFHLPIRAVDTAHDEHPPSGTGAEATHVDDTPGASLRDIRVLVVDDDFDSLEVLRVVLESAGAKVTTATSAREALEAGEAFEIIISDIGMPEMDGYTFIRRIRSRSSGANVPAIALTAYARAEDAERAMRAGYQEHLAKPVDQRRLLEAVKTWSHASASAG